MKEKDRRKLEEIQETLDYAKADWDEYLRHTDASKRRLRTAVSFARSACDKLGHIKPQLGKQWAMRYDSLLKSDKARFLQGFRDAIQHNATMPNTGWSLYIDSFNTGDIHARDGETVIETIIGESMSNGGNYQIVRIPDGTKKKRYFSISQSSTRTFVEGKNHQTHILERDLPVVIDQLQSLIDEARRILE